MEGSAPLIVESTGEATKRCPDCAETVLADAHVCKHCGYRFAPATEGGKTAQTVAGLPASMAAVIAGLVLLAIGSIAPWATIFAISVAGTHGDGKLTLGLAAFAALMLATQRRIPVAFAFLAALVAAITAGYDLAHIEHVASRTTIFGVQAASAGWGLYVALLGAVIAVLALIAEHARLYKRAS